MPLTDSSLISFALTEYRRDNNFQFYVDNIVGMMLRAGVVQPGCPLETIMGRELQSGELCAKALLRGYHSQSDQPQWRKLRDSESARPA